jgi:predicted ATP-grasp superfamily ATP-dependent carboligase
MSFRSTVLVYEFLTGGGCPAGDLPAGLSSEALGMLWALLTDFRRWGCVRTITALDPRFEGQVPGLNRGTLPADEVVIARQCGHKEIYQSLLDRCDAAIIIAPETDGILARLTAQAEKAGIPVCGSCASAVARAGDKSVCHRLFREANLPTPDTHLVSFAAVFQAAKLMDFPLVIKPVDGIGCEGVCRVDRLSDLAGALAMVRRVTSHDEILLQSFTAGAHVSASLLIAGEHCLPLSLNSQLIEAGSPFRYLGNEIPFEHKAGLSGLTMACSAAFLIQGLRGYVGVDLILKEESAEIIEINPRLTTSYIGLRQIAQVNLAQTIWEACMNGILPARIPLAGRVAIRKDNPASWNLSV